MKQIKHKEILEFTYDTEEEREEHIKLMQSQGWNISGKTSKLKDNVSIMSATDDDYEWYSDFWKYH